MSVLQRYSWRLLLVTGVGIALNVSSVTAEGIAKTRKAAAIAGGTTRRSTNPDMAHIPAGKFQMGSPEWLGNPDEHPLHSVYLNAFLLDKHETTCAQYRLFQKARGNPDPACPDGDFYPALASWADAAAYCKWLGKRLPTEAEWEKAARPNSQISARDFAKQPNPWGEFHWYGKHGPNPLSRIGETAPNAYGLYDMHGNAWEWCSDWYDPSYYQTSPTSNPGGPSGGQTHVLRGGSWHTGLGVFVSRTGVRLSMWPKVSELGGIRCAK